MIAADVRVDTCLVERVVPEHWEINAFGQQTLVYATPPAIAVRFAATGPRALRTVRIALVEGRVAVTSVAIGGTFAPGVEIAKTLALPATTILSEPVTCVPLSVTRDDGTTWTNAAPPQPLSF